MRSGKCPLHVVFQANTDRRAALDKLPRLLQAVDIVAGRLTFVAVTDRDAFVDVMTSQDMIEYNIDRELVRSASDRLFCLLLWHTLLSPHRLINSACRCTGPSLRTSGHSILD